MSATKKMVSEELPVVVEAYEGAGTSAHAETKKSMTSLKIATEIPRYPDVTDVDWLHIFAKLDPETKATFSRVSDGWHDKVAGERPEFLSKGFAPILIDNLPQEALLKSRELCRSWTTELNHHLQGDQFQVRLPSEISKDRGAEMDEEGAEGPGRLINILTTSEVIQGFLMDMEGHTGNPFPGGTIELWFDSWKAVRNSFKRKGELDLAREGFWTNAVVLLQEFGSHISYFRFHRDKRYSAGSTRPLVENLRDCLLNLPNLKRLSIEGFYSSELNIMQDWLTRNPLPLLPNLEIFDTTQGSSMDASRILTNAVLDNCIIMANMKVVFFKSMDAIDPPRRLPDQVLNFVNLEVLKAPLDDLQDLEGLGNLAQRPPLRELILDSSDSTPTPVDTHQLFEALESFGNTLTHLVLKVFSDLDLSRWMSTHINLPNLKEISLPYFTGSLDPLIQLTSLAVLRIDYNTDDDFDDDDDEPVGEGSRVEFYGFQKRLYDSNIWQLIPSLESIDICIFTYERRYLGRLSGAQNETAESGSSPETSD